MHVFLGLVFDPVETIVMGLAVVPYFAQNASTSSSEGGFWILMAFFPSSLQSFLALFLQVLSCRKTFALLVCRLSLCALAWSCFLRESFVLAMSSWFFNAKFLPDFVSFGISYIRFLLQFCDDGDVCSELCYFQFNFVAPCFLGLETYALFRRSVYHVNDGPCCCIQQVVDLGDVEILPLFDVVQS